MLTGRPRSTSLVDLGLPVSMADVDVALRQSFENVMADGHRAADACAKR